MNRFEIRAQFCPDGAQEAVKKGLKQKRKGPTHMTPCGSGFTQTKSGGTIKSCIRRDDMLNQEGFDLWAGGYDRSVGRSDESDTYPFAGYKNVLSGIYSRVLSRPGRTVLDIGFGTAVLAAKLYARGCTIFGQDFSSRMLALAQEKMPEARLYQGDFSQGLAEALRQNQYDAIVATYSLHHLTDDRKAAFLHSLLPLLRKGGAIYIGDVAFRTRAQLEQCRVQAGNQWDEDEIYFVYEELKRSFPEMEFQQVSHCAGILSLER